MPAAKSPLPNSLPGWLALLLLAHLLLGALRLPGSVVARRMGEIAACEREGHAAFALRTAYLDGAAAIAQLRATTPADAVIPIRGVPKGALEFAPALLWPRLCCYESALPTGAGAMHDGRPIANVVLVGDGPTLALQPREPR